MNMSYPTPVDCFSWILSDAEVGISYIASKVKRRGLRHAACGMRQLGLIAGSPVGPEINIERELNELLFSSLSQRLTILRP